MKLFTVKEVRESKDAQVSRDIYRVQEVRKVLTDNQKELARSEADFNVSISRQRLQFIKMQEEEMIKIDALKKEVVVLEDRKKIALSPIDSVEKKAQNMFKEAGEALSKVREKQEEIDGVSEKLMDRLDIVSEKETDLNNKEKDLFKRELGIKNQEGITSEHSKLLSQEIERFRVKQSDCDAENDRKKTELILKEKGLISKEENLNSIEKEQNIERIRIADQRVTLQIGFEELRRKQNG